MASRGQDTENPTVLWIAWDEAGVEHREPLCLAHRASVFEHHPASVRGLKRRGDVCSMCKRRDLRIV